MSENSVETTDQAPAQESTQGEKTFTQAQLDKIISNRLPEYESLKAKAAQLDGLTESAKTAEEKLADYKSKAEAAEAELSWRDTLLLRQELAAKNGLDSRLWSRIRGETSEEIEADIKELAGYTGSKRPGALKSGASTDGPASAKERAAQALRGFRETSR